MDLGQDSNYKTVVIQNRWEAQRQRWLDVRTHRKTMNVDIREGKETESIPNDHK